MRDGKTFKNWLIASAIVIFVFVVFYPALRNDFVNSDDSSYLLNNQSYRGLHIENLKWIFFDSYKNIGIYIPLAWLTWSADYVVWGMNPLGYHLTNIIIHAFTAGALYFLAYRLLGLGFGGATTDSSLKFGAAFTALIWATHPLRVESVVWITERKDVLCGLFFVLTILAYIYYVQTNKRKWYWFSLGLALFALLSKPMAVSIPFVLLILDFYPLRRVADKFIFGKEARKIYFEKISFAILSLAVSTLTFFVLYNLGDAITSKNILTIGDRLLIMSYDLRFYLEKMAVPIDLAPLYELGYKLIDLRGHYIFHYSFAVVLLILVLSLRKRLPAVFFTFIFFVVTLIPVSGIVQAGRQIAADRFTYIPSMGLALLAGCALTYMWQFFSIERPNPRILKIIFPAAGVILLIFSTLTWSQVKIWKNSKTMWEHTVLISPNSYYAHYQLGNTLIAEGNLDEAIKQYKLAIALSPNYTMAYFSLANAFVKKNDFVNASNFYEFLIQNDSSLEPAWINLGVVLVKEGYPEKAIRLYEQALQINSHFLGVKENLEKIKNKLNSK